MAKMTKKELDAAAAQAEAGEHGPLCECPGCGRGPEDEVGAGCPQCADLDEGKYPNPEAFHRALISVADETLVRDAPEGFEPPAPEAMVEARARWLCCLLEASTVLDSCRLKDIAQLFQDGLPALGTSAEWAADHWTMNNDDYEAAERDKALDETLSILRSY
jgi:hypothetical protein